MNNTITMKELKHNLKKYNLNERFEDFVNDYYLHEIEVRDIFELQYLNTNKNKFNYFYYNKYDVIEGLSKEFEQQTYKKHNIGVLNQYYLSF